MAAYPAIGPQCFELIGRFSAIKALAKSFKDAGFANEFRKLTGVDPFPITSDAIEAAIKDLPRDPETIALYKHLADHRPCHHAEGANVLPGLKRT